MQITKVPVLLGSSHREKVPLAPGNCKDVIPRIPCRGVCGTRWKMCLSMLSCSACASLLRASLLGFFVLLEPLDRSLRNWVPASRFSAACSDCRLDIWFGKAHCKTSPLRPFMILSRQGCKTMSPFCTFLRRMAPMSNQKRWLLNYS